MRADVPNKQAAVYLRVSTEEQIERQSVQNQRQTAEEYCQRHEIPVYDWYSDEGVSGSIPVEKRPAGARLFQDAKDRRFGIVLVYKIDRLARSTLDLLRFVQLLEQYEVALQSMNEAIETVTPEGRFMLRTFGSVAELEREIINRRSQDGRKRIVRLGGWVGGSAPFGYRLGPAGLEIAPEEAATVRMIFELCLNDGLGTVAIANLLTAKSIPTPMTAGGTPRGSGRWNQSTVWAILRNSTYSGEYHYAKERRVREQGAMVGYARNPIERHVLGAVPPIVTPEQSAAAARQLKENFSGARRNAKRDYLLRGLVKCGLCGRSYSGCGGHGEGHFYYRCLSCVNGQEKCGNGHVRAGELEETVWSDVCSLLNEPSEVLASLAGRMRERVAEHRPVEEEQTELDRQLSAKETERGRVITLLRKGTITEAEGERELHALQLEAEALEARRGALAEREARIENNALRLVSARSLLLALRGLVASADFERRRFIATRIIDRIEVESPIGQPKAETGVRIFYCFDPSTPESNCSSGVFTPEEQLRHEQEFGYS